MAKKFEEMTEAEKRESFEKWVESRTARKGVSKVRRTAMQQLIKLHQDEYNDLVKKLGGKATAPKPQVG